MNFDKINLEAPVQAELQQAFYDTVHHGKIPLKDIAAECGESINYYTRVGLPLNQGGCYYQVQKLTKLINLAGRYDILDVLERSVGRIGVPLPSPEGASKNDIFRLALQSTKEFGELIDEVNRAMEDNVIKSSERKRIMKEGFESVQAILTLMEACKEE